MKLTSLLLILLLVLMVGCSTTVEESTNETIDSETEDFEDEESEESFEVKITSKNSDLKPNIMSSKLYPGLNGKSKLTFEVSNEGIAKLQNEFNYEIEITRNGVSQLKKENTTLIEMMPGDDSEIFEMEYVFKEYGTYKVKLILDTTNSIDEAREENNEKEITIYVKESTSGDDDEEEDDSDEGSSSDGLCSDSDGGKDYDKVGTCTDETFTNGRTDVCADDSRLMEVYCLNSRCSIDVKECENICKNGICI